MRLMLMGLVIGLVGLAVQVGARQSKPANKVEYLVIHVPASPQELQDALNGRGGQGWILIGEVRTALGESLVLKRESDR